MSEAARYIIVFACGCVFAMSVIGAFAVMAWEGNRHGPESSPRYLPRRNRRKRRTDKGSA